MSGTGRTVPSHDTRNEETATRSVGGPDRSGGRRRRCPRLPAGRLHLTRPIGRRAGLVGGSGRAGVDRTVADRPVVRGPVARGAVASRRDDDAAVAARGDEPGGRSARPGRDDRTGGRAPGRRRGHPDGAVRASGSAGVDVGRRRVAAAPGRHRPDGRTAGGRHRRWRRPVGAGRLGLGARCRRGHRRPVPVDLHRPDHLDGRRAALVPRRVSPGRGRRRRRPGGRGRRERGRRGRPGHGRGRRWGDGRRPSPVPRPAIGRRRHPRRCHRAGHHRPGRLTPVPAFLRRRPELGRFDLAVRQRVGQGVRRRRGHRRFPGGRRRPSRRRWLRPAGRRLVLPGRRRLAAGGTA